MTDEQLIEFMGLKGHRMAKAVVAQLTPEKRALYEDMAKVEAEVELWIAGLGPKPAGIMIDFDRKTSR